MMPLGHGRYRRAGRDRRGDHSSRAVPGPGRSGSQFAVADPDQLASRIVTAVAAAFNGATPSDFITIGGPASASSSLSVSSRGGPDGGAEIILNRSVVYAKGGGAGGGRGIVVSVVDQSKNTFTTRVFDTWQGKSLFLPLASYLQSIPAGSLVAITINDEGGFINYAGGHRGQPPKWRPDIGPLRHSERLGFAR